jgi:hypothetical protein
MDSRYRPASLVSQATVALLVLQGVLLPAMAIDGPEPPKDQVPRQKRGEVVKGFFIEHLVPKKNQFTIERLAPERDYNADSQSVTKSANTASGKAEEDTGSGVLLFEPPITLYEAPNDHPTSARLTLTWEKIPVVQDKTNPRSLPQYRRQPRHFGVQYRPGDPIQALPYPRDYFLHFSPDKHLYSYQVTDEQDGWVQIKTPFMFGGQGRHSAWIRLSECGPQKDTTPAPDWQQRPTVPADLLPRCEVIGWPQYIRETARSFGFQWKTDVSPQERTVFTSPSDEAPLLPLRVMKGSRAMHVRGNWMMVEVLDAVTPGWQMGWVRWRTDDGKVLLNPSL